MFDIITALVTNLFRTFIMKKYLEIFFFSEDRSADNRKEKIFYFLFYLITTSVYLMFHYPPANIAINIIMTYFLTQLYPGEQKKKILVALLVYGINMICDVLSIYSFSDYVVGQNYNEIAAYVTVLYIFLCELLTERIWMKKKAVRQAPPYWGLLLLVPVISIGVLFVLIMSNLNNRILLVSMSSGILFLNMLVFYLYYALLEMFSRIQDNLIFERQIASYANQLDIMMQSEEKIRALRHDMKHHLNELSRMAEAKKNTEITAYIHTMQSQMISDKEYISTGNKNADSILNYMIRQAKEKLIQVECKVTIPREANMPLFDWNIILGNLLENAIMASEKSEEKWLSIFIKYEKGILFLQIRNSYTDRIQKIESEYISTKKTKEDHGIGLKNVKKIVEKYNGSIDISDVHNIFDVKVMLYLTETA